MKQTQTTQVEKLNPQEFGLEESNVATIEQAFAPKIIEREALASQYEELISKEITPELCQDFKALRLKLVKVRTGIAEIHKTQKAYFLSAGRFVDAWKNKETAPIEQMEEKLRDGEEYYERLEAKRIADLETERRAVLSEFTDVFPASLGQLSDEAFITYLTGAKVAYNARIQAEKEEVERVKKEAERKQRDDNRFKIFAGTGMIFTGGVFANQKASFDFVELCELSDDEFVASVQKATDIVAECKAEEIKEKERLRILAEQAAKEKAEQEASAEAERKKAAEEKARQDAIIAKQKAELDAKLKAESEAKAAEEKLIAEEKAEAERLAKAPKKEQLTKWIDDIVVCIPVGLANEDVVHEIMVKFDGFQKWAKGIIEKL